MVKRFEVVHNCKKKNFYFSKTASPHYIFCKQCSIFFKKNTYEEKSNRTKNLKKFHLNVEQKIKSREYLNKIEIDKFLINKFIKLIGHKPKKLLDYGCGYGSMLFAAKNLKINVVVGYDINSFLINSLKKKFLVIKKKSELIRIKKKFDCVVVNKVLNLSPNVEEDFFILSKILKNKGYVILVEQVKDFSRYGSFPIRRNNNTHVITINSIKYFSDKFGFKIKKISNSFGDLTCFLQKDKNVRKFRETANFTPRVYYFYEKYKYIFNFTYSAIFELKKIVKKLC